jgi:hypothetical protein
LNIKLADAENADFKATRVTPDRIGAVDRDRAMRAGAIANSSDIGSRRSGKHLTRRCDVQAADAVDAIKAYAENPDIDFHHMLLTRSASTVTRQRQSIWRWRMVWEKSLSLHSCAPTKRSSQQLTVTRSASAKHLNEPLGNIIAGYQS